MCVADFKNTTLNYSIAYDVLFNLSMLFISFIYRVSSVFAFMCAIYIFLIE